jgi:adenine-specific DNA-methyltransferase
MLEFESRKNNTFLNLENLESPFDYTIDYIDENNQRQPKKVDLIETFNYIAGIEVKSQNLIKDDRGKTYIVVKGKREDRSCVVIWRNIKENFSPQTDKDFIESKIIGVDSYDDIYTNGGSSVKNGKILDEIFKSKMFSD